jgi:hypothetical protein
MRRRRSAYTLLEVLLSLAISVLVLSAVYSVIGYQLKQAQAGREVIERATLSRAIFNKMGQDVTVAISQNDPARFRRSSNSSGGSGGTSDASGSGGTTAAASGNTAASGAATGGATGTGSTNTGNSTTGGTSGTGTDATSSADTPVQLPLGVVGTATELHLFVSKIPQDGPMPPPPAGGDAAAQPPNISDLQRISYWLGDAEVGLCRFESRLITSDEATTPSIPSGDATRYKMAPEVRSLEFSYFDGTSWTDSWDSTSPGPDGVTPLGSPRAVSVKIGVPRSGHPDSELRYYRQVFTVLTAGGTPVNNSTDQSGTTGQSTTP